jgi:hypothetical protein
MPLVQLCSPPEYTAELVSNWLLAEQASAKDGMQLQSSRAAAVAHACMR